MKIKLLFFFLFVQSVFSQTIIKGKIISDIANLEGIYIVNTSTKTSTSTNPEGYFSIEAKPNDILVIFSLSIEGLEVRLNDSSFKQSPLIIKVKAKINELDEIEVNKFTTKSLGIVSKNVKEYTPAERKVRTAEKFKWYSPLLIPFGGMSVDGLINQISGRTKMLKKGVLVEKKEKELEKLDLWFDDDFYIKTLKIPDDYVEGFKLFALDDIDLLNSMSSKNKTLATFLLGEIAVKYKNLTFPEKN
ncbi:MULTISPECIES: hypothetical protein [Flavobacterium]|uniref:Carboxypeptidase-like regulatory domain-containing protein n=1 Tax=Flavobacterium hankyongi TaxID=1176532 RepID=A0ABP8ZTK1_9FLAO|nr:hypothetical protein [Flavobacterium sp. N1846]